MEQIDSHWKRRTILFFISQGVTLFGSALVQFAIVWYVTLKTTSGAWVAALTVCSLLPQTLISFVSGAWADRYSKKMLIIISDAVIAAATLALIFTPILAGLYIGSVVLIALRKKLGKWLSIGTLAISALYITIGIIVAVSEAARVEIAAVVGSILVNIVLHGLFALYFIVSKRVQLTLVR